MMTQGPAYSLRIPPELKEALQRTADKNRRSLNAEIIVAIEQHIKRETNP